MQHAVEKQVVGLPNEAKYAGDVAVCRARLTEAINKFLANVGPMPLNVQVVTSDFVNPQRETSAKQSDHDELTTEQRAEQYASASPLHQLNQLIVPESMMAQIDLTIHSIRVEPTVYDTWGLRKIG